VKSRRWAVEIEVSKAVFYICNGAFLQDGIYKSIVRQELTLLAASIPQMPMHGAITLGSKPMSSCVTSSSCACHDSNNVSLLRSTYDKKILSLR
jgi:hypothetical protein